MSDIEKHHLEAMELAELALQARRAGDLTKFRAFSMKAFKLERGAAEEACELVDFEPSRSILIRSAASLALDCGEEREAEKLVSRGLAGDPPEQIAEELRDLLENVYLARHLRTQDVQLAPEDLQLSIAGPAVGHGLILKGDFDARVDSVQKLARRTAERRQKLPFQDSRQAVASAPDWQTWLSVPRAASFAVTIRFGSATGQKLLKWDNLVQATIDDLLENLGVLNDKGPQAIDLAIPDPVYRANFLALAKRLAPDGRDVNLVGLTVLRGSRPHTLALRLPRSQVVVPGSGKGKTSKIEEFRGVLRGADATSRRHKCSVVAESGTAINFTVPEGLLDDIVRPMWGQKVVVRARVFSGTKRELVDVNRDS